MRTGVHNSCTQLGLFMLALTLAGPACTGSSWWCSGACGCMAGDEHLHVAPPYRNTACSGAAAPAARSCGGNRRLWHSRTPLFLISPAPLCFCHFQQIFCGRLRVMAQPHIRDPPPGPAAADNGPAAEGDEAAGEEGDGAEAAAGDAAAAGAAGADAAGEEAAAAAAAAAGAVPGAVEQQNAGHCWVPDVMRCRWRRDPQQRRLLPRLRANLRAMALCALIIGGTQKACWLLKGRV